MAIKATLKKGKTVTTTATSPAPVVDVEASVDLEAAVAGEQEPTETSASVSTAVATRTASTGGAVERYQQNNGEGFEGDWGSIPLKFPQLKLVQGSGKLSKEFNVGTVIYNEAELFPPVNKAKKEAPHRLRFVPLQITLQFREKLSQEAVDEGLQPQIVNSVREVEDAGGTTRWFGSTMPDNYWEPSARNLFLLEKPENNEHPGFALDLDGKQYAVAVYYAAGGAFRASSKLIHETAKTSLFVPVINAEGKPVFNGKVPVKRALLYKCIWTIEWDMVTAGKFTPYRPAVRLLKDETGPEVREYCEMLIGNSAARAAAAANDADA